MESTIKQYGEGSGDKILISKENAKAVAQAVWDGAHEAKFASAPDHLDKMYHKYFSDAELNGNFDNIWSHYDVLSEGKINIDQLQPMLRMVKQDTSMQLN